MQPSFNDLVIKEKLSDVEIAYIKEKFWKNVTKTKYCWNWKSTSKTYGTVRVCKKTIFPARFSYELEFGKIPENLKVYHYVCKNRLCVNPSHMTLLTQNELVLQGNAPTAINLRKTKCHRGHLLEDSNVFITKRGHRGCRTCKRISARKYQAKTYKRKEKIVQVFYR